MTIQEAIAAHEQVREGRDRLVFGVFELTTDNDALSVATLELAKILKRETPDLEEPVELIALFLAETATLAALALAKPPDRGRSN